MTCRIAALAALALLAAAPAATAAPGRPAAARLRAPAAPLAVTILTADSVRISGRWYPGPPRSSTIVLPPRRRGADDELSGVATEFQRRGFNALTFTLRDPAFSDPSRDSLRYMVMVSHWVDDAVAALREAAARTDSTARVFAWGQGLGGALAVSAAGRPGSRCDGLAVERVFRLSEEVLRDNGTAVIADVSSQQHRLLIGRDEPYSAASRMSLPVLAVLTGPAAGTDEDTTLAVMHRNRGRVDRWMRPWLSGSVAVPTPAEVDTLAAWFRRWVSVPRPH